MDPMEEEEEVCSSMDMYEEEESLEHEINQENEEDVRQPGTHF